MDRPFLAVVRDVLCGIVSYAIARWGWRQDPWSWETLGREIATFFAVFLVLRLLLAAWGRGLRRRRERRAFQRHLRATAPPPSRPT